MVETVKKAGAESTFRCRGERRVKVNAADAYLGKEMKLSCVFP